MKRRILSLLLLFSIPNCILAAPDAIVASDGTGDYASIQAAIMAAPYRANKPHWIIKVKPGIYQERLYIQRERGNIRLVGEDPATTILTGKLHANLPGPDGAPIGTFRTATAQIDGDGFEIENLTIENTAGPVGQALALRADGDRLVFRNCRFLGWQDTVFLNRGRQYFSKCHIEGHVDFIFGGSTAWFEECVIHSRKAGYLTAASTPPEQAFGFVFHRCTLTGMEPYYLGRPWRAHAMTVFIDCHMDKHVRPEGWKEWNADDHAATVRYGELRSAGPGSSPEKRVAWTRPVPVGISMTGTLGGSDHWNPNP
jgi:pectinesterase